MSVQLQSNLTERFRNLVFHENEVERTMSKECTEFEEYDIEIVTKSDERDVVDLARKFFNRDEPLNESIGLTGPDGICPDLEDYLTNSLEEGTSVKAVSNGKLVAFSMNGIVYKDGPKEKSLVDDPKFQTILDFLHYNSEQCDFFKKYPHVNKAMSVKIISVDPCMRGKGVATKLVDKTRELAKEHGCEMIFVECTSHYSACIMKRLGFEKIYSLKYSDYKVDGNTVFQPKEPHTEFTVYVQRI